MILPVSELSMEVTRDLSKCLGLERFVHNKPVNEPKITATSHTKTIDPPFHHAYHRTTNHGDL